MDSDGAKDSEDVSDSSSLGLSVVDTSASSTSFDPQEDAQVGMEVDEDDDDESEAEPIEMDDQDEDEDIVPVVLEENATPRTNPSQRLNAFKIFLIDVYRVDEEISKKNTKNSSTNNNPSINDSRRYSNEERVRFIVDSYNEKIQPKYCRGKRKRNSDHLKQTSLPQSFASSSSSSGSQTKMRMTPTDPENGSGSPIPTPAPAPEGNPNLPSPNKDLTGKYKNMIYKLDFKSDAYNLKIFSQSRPAEDPETGEKIEILSKVRFLLRKPEIRKTTDEIFAIPSNYGHFLVQKWADTQFPMSIAAAILKPSSVENFTVRRLFSNRYHSKHFNRNPETFNRQDGPSSFCPQITTCFRAMVQNEEIQNILIPKKTEKISTSLATAPQKIMQKKITKFFKNEPASVSTSSNNFGAMNSEEAPLEDAVGTPSRTPILKCETGSDSLCFRTRTDMSTYARLCEKLWAMYQDKGLPRSREFDQYLTSVNNDVTYYLNLSLLKDLKKFIFHSQHFSTEKIDSIRANRSRCRNFLVGPKNFESYTQANNIWLVYEGTKTTKWQTPPTFLEICGQVKNLRDKIDKSRLEIVDFLKKLKLSFDLENDGIKIVHSQNLLSCLEGNYFDSGLKKSFLKYDRQWYELGYSYLYEIHLKFGHLLDSCVLDSEAEENLNLTWPLKKYKDKMMPVQEPEYNLLYKNMPNFILGDDDCVLDGIEIFDLLRYIPQYRENKGQKSCLWFYHIKRQFEGQCIRIVGSQIIQAANYLQDGKALKPLYTKFTQGTEAPNLIKDNFANFEQFQEECGRATFVLGIVHLAPETRLKTHHACPLKFGVQKVHNMVTKLRKKLKRKLKRSQQTISPGDGGGGGGSDGLFGVAQIIHGLMKNFGYLDDQDGVTKKLFDCLSFTSQLGKYKERSEFKIFEKNEFNFLLTKKEMEEIHEAILSTIKTSDWQCKGEGLASKLTLLDVHSKLLDNRLGFQICEISHDHIGL